MPLLLCDLDDTLVDRQEAFRRWGEHFARQHRLHLPAVIAWLVELDAHGYSSRSELVASIAERFGVWPDQARALAQFRHDLAMAVPEISREARRSLIFLRRSGWKIAIVTNGTEPQQMLKLRVAGLEPLVDACVVSEAVGCSKPNPAIFRYAAAACECQMSGGWMIGDNPEADILGAAEVGLNTIWVKRGRTWPVRGVRPTLEVASVEEGLVWILDQGFS